MFQLTPLSHPIGSFSESEVETAIRRASEIVRVVKSATDL